MTLARNKRRNLFLDGFADTLGQFMYAPTTVSAVRKKTNKPESTVRKHAESAHNNGLLRIAAWSKRGVGGYEKVFEIQPYPFAYPDAPVPEGRKGS